MLIIHLHFYWSKGFVSLLKRFKFCFVLFFGGGVIFVSLFCRSLLGGGFDMTNDVISSAMPGMHGAGTHIIRHKNAWIEQLQLTWDFLFSSDRFWASERDGSLPWQPVWPCTDWQKRSMRHNSLTLTHLTNWEKIPQSTIYCTALWSWYKTHKNTKIDQYNTLKEGEENLIKWISSVFSWLAKANSQKTKTQGTHGKNEEETLEQGHTWSS